VSCTTRRKKTANSKRRRFYKRYPPNWAAGAIGIFSGVSFVEQIPGWTGGEYKDRQRRLKAQMKRDGIPESRWV